MTDFHDCTKCSDPRCLRCPYALRTVEVFEQQDKVERLDRAIDGARMERAEAEDAETAATARAEAAEAAQAANLPTDAMLTALVERGALRELAESFMEPFTPDAGGTGRRHATRSRLVTPWRDPTP